MMENLIAVVAEPSKWLYLGIQGENNARQVVFDVSDWQAVYGPGTVQLLVQRTGETTPYPAALTVDGSRAIWTITAADTAIPGQSGKAELRYLIGDTLAKSETWTTIVADALGEPSEAPPEAYQGWVDQVLQAGADVQTNAAQVRADAEAAGKARQDLETARDEAGQSAGNAAASEKNAAVSERNAAISAGAAQTALQGMTFVTITTAPNGHVIVKNGDLLGTTAFRLIPASADINAGHLEVKY